LVSDIDKIDVDGHTVLFKATCEERVRHGNCEQMELLLRDGADPNIGSHDTGATPLHIAATYTVGKAASLLLQSGANPEILDNSGMPPLHVAILNRCREVTKLLVECAGQSNVTDRWGRTPLHLAAKQSASSTLKLLLDHGADCNFTDGWGRTPLHIAASAGEFDNIKELLLRGADPSARDRNRETAATCAAKEVPVNYKACCKYQDIVQFLTRLALGSPATSRTR